MALSGHHRDTAQRILAHPTSGNVEWRQVISLVEAIGEVDDSRDRNGDNRWGDPE